MEIDLNNLASRVEGLIGPDRAVDAAVFMVTQKFPERAYQQRIGLRAKGSTEPSREQFLMDGYAPAYTASIDAAMTLVPKGMDWSAGTQTDLGDGKRAWGNTSPGSIAFVAESEITTEAATPALALVSAALRARSRTQGNHNG